MLIDCDSCAVRGAACAGCLVSALLDTPQDTGQLTAEEQRAIEVFARAGFGVAVLAEPPAPRLRLVPRARARRHVA